MYLSLFLTAKCNLQKKSFIFPSPLSLCIIGVFCGFVPRPPPPPPGNPAGVRWTFFTFLSCIKINISLGVDCVCYYDESLFWVLEVTWRPGTSLELFLHRITPNVAVNTEHSFAGRNFGFVVCLGLLKGELQTNLKIIKRKYVDLSWFTWLRNCNSVWDRDLHIQRRTGLGSRVPPLSLGSIQTIYVSLLALSGDSPTIKDICWVVYSYLL